MRALLQRVSRASVSVDGRLVSAIGQGIVILAGVTHGDKVENAEWLAQKISSLRIFEDSDGKMNLSIIDVKGAILLVSQFTLYANTNKGRRPSFTRAALPDEAEPLISVFAELIRARGIPVETGVFGADMAVEIHNDGPVTLMLER
jgi:D-tyrosyl-tRNA(Tyr) deacylase